jgi:signal transduction histidine kinase/CHASE3 domain sensor protein
LRLLSSALFWRVLLSSLLVVAVLGVGLFRATAAHEELEKQFERLVSHDLKLADDAEVLLRVLSDLETSKRGYLLTRNDQFLEPYEDAKKELDTVLIEASATAENGMEDERVATFARLIREWIENVSEPQIAATRDHREMPAALAETGKTRTDTMREILTQLRRHALDAADSRKVQAFESAGASRRATSSLIVIAIVLTMGIGIWIARDVSTAAAQLEEAMEATGRLEQLPPLDPRRDELGAVGRSLVKMSKLLMQKDSDLRATLAERERTLAELLRANAALAEQDALARRYAEFVRELKTLDVKALSTSGLLGLVRLADAELGVVYLLDGASRLVPVHATTVDDRTLDHRAFHVDGLPRSVMSKHEAVFLSGIELGETPPKVDLGVTQVPVRWVLGVPIAVGDDLAGALVLGGLRELGAAKEESLRDAARQLGVGLHNAWTHDRLREKSVMLAEQGETLTRANKVKTEFLASMSHELRTPLSAILGFADLLMSSPREQLSPRARESLERIKRNGEHLLTLINDVLDLAKAEAGRTEVRLSTVNIVQLARACAAEVDSLRGAKELRLVVDGPDGGVEVSTDPQRVRQVLLNLLSNAIKFTERGEVHISVRATSSEVRIAVRDTGIGIPARALGELFQEFHQLEAGDGKRYDGTGIGLALSRRLARALGGEIEVRSSEHEGSTFTLVLPRGLAPSLESIPPPAPSTTALPS